MRKIIRRIKFETSNLSPTLFSLAFLLALKRCERKHFILSRCFSIDVTLSHDVWLLFIGGSLKEKEEFVRSSAFCIPTTFGIKINFNSCCFIAKKLKLRKRSKSFACLWENILKELNKSLTNSSVDEIFTLFIVVYA
ncbi:CLUMA_CG010879, isoform A [Clunio marinus]|uniref:CLUMA_CG010879, isoform A n=1 Tax=Clunio marinus TaxID=568069 RepID=A0A1J1ICK7_9DIPT|nr:CLUMA_CG010879, isoform A [Clunio marinus]